VKQQQLCRVIQLALRAEDAIPNNEESKSKQVLLDAFAKEHPLRILLAEDNPVNQKLAVRVLNKLGYGHIEIAQNGVEAIEKYNSDTYDVILMDIQMPEMDGLEATRRIRAQHGRKPIIISMTANVMPEDREACIQAGTNDYIAKPIKLEELVNALRTASMSLASNLN
jgi:CheY-like chemotaxis protein